MEPSPEDLLRRLYDRDAEISVLLQRASLLNRHHDYQGTNNLARETEELGSRGALEKSLAVTYGCQEKVSNLKTQASAVGHVPDYVRSTSYACDCIPGVYGESFGKCLVCRTQQQWQPDTPIEVQYSYYVRLQQQ